MTRDEQQTLLLEGCDRGRRARRRVLQPGAVGHGHARRLEAQACYKAKAGERPLWDFPDGLWRREVAAYELDVALGHRPRARRRSDATTRPFGPVRSSGGSTTTKRTTTSRCANGPSSTTGSPLAAFDVVANNADRKAGHVLYDGERLWAIDNGLCFHEAGQAAHGHLGVRRTRRRTRTCSSASAASRAARPARSALAQSQRTGARAVPRARTRGERLYPEPDEASDWPPVSLAADLGRPSRGRVVSRHAGLEHDERDDGPDAKEDPPPTRTRRRSRARRGTSTLRPRWRRLDQRPQRHGDRNGVEQRSPIDPPICWLVFTSAEAAPDVARVERPRWRSRSPERK